MGGKKKVYEIEEEEEKKEGGGDGDDELKDEEIGMELTTQRQKEMLL